MYISIDIYIYIIISVCIYIYMCVWNIWKDVKLPGYMSYRLYLYSALEQFCSEVHFVKSLQGDGVCFRCLHPTKTHLLHSDMDWGRSIHLQYLLQVELLSKLLHCLVLSHLFVQAPGEFSNRSWTWLGIDSLELQITLLDELSVIAFQLCIHPQPFDVK